MMPAFLVRTAALVRKETRQMVRDKTTLALGILLPIVLLILFGYGLSFDVDNAPVAVVRDTSSPIAREMEQKLALSPYFSPVMAGSWQEAEAMLRAYKVDAIVRLAPKDRGDATVCAQVIVSGRDVNKARLIRTYLTGALGQWIADRNGVSPAIETRARVLYNHALESRFFLVPGVNVLVVTLIGALLTSLVVAREWERGTWEALLSTRAGRFEIIVSKTLPYFCLGMLGSMLCLTAGRWVFGVPMRGSLAVIVAGSALYLVVCLGIGLAISSLTRSQFLSCMASIVISFMPTFLLSGFIFDTKSAPDIAYWISLLFPATWYVELLTTELLAGEVPRLLVRDLAILAFDAAALFGLAASKINKTLE